MGLFDNNFDDDPEDRLAQEAEELMRQGRFKDAAARYSDLRQTAPGDLWAALGHASALECAGEVRAAEMLLDEAAGSHRSNLHLMRFQRMFFERREDLHRAVAAREAIRHKDELFTEGPPDQLADMFFNQGRYNEALNELQRLLREEEIEDSTTRAGVLARIGACLRQDARLDEAREQLLAALTLEGSNHWTLAELAETERALGNMSAARGRYLEALQANPDDNWCRGHLAQLEHEDGNTSEAVLLYEQILADDSHATWAMVELAQVLTEDDPDASAELCEDALREDPSYPWAWAHLGVLARTKGQYDQAREHLLKALEASPTSTWILHEIADTCRNMGRLEEARAHLDHARSINPFDATSYGYTADILRTQGQGDQAVPFLVKAVELDDSYCWAWRELAELEAQRGNHDKAEQAFQRACALEPDEAINDGLHAFLLRCQDRRAEAVPLLERAVERQADYLWAWRELVEYHLLAGEGPRAEHHAREALKVLPDSPQMWALLAEALRLQGKRDEARDFAQRALAREQSVPQLWALCAELEVDRDPAEALRHAQQAVDLDQGVDYRLLLSQVQLAAGETEAAGETLAGLLQERPTPIGAYDMAAELAEREQDHTSVCELLERGLAEHPDSVHLVLRRARAGLALDETDPTAALRRLDQNAEVPWREVAQLCAQARDPLGARHATAMTLSQATTASEQAHAWLLLSEVELMLGERNTARQAANEALGHDDELPAALIMAAMLAEDDSDQAVGYLDRLRERCVTSDKLDNDERAMLLRQLALLYDRHERLDAAESCWDQAQTLDDSDEIRLERARHLVRRQHAEAACELLAGAIARRDDCTDTEGRQLLGELAQARFQASGAAAARDELASRDASELDDDLRAILAQLCLAEDDHAGLERALEPCTTRTAAVLRARGHLARLHPEAAISALAPYQNDNASDEEIASLHAEALALQGHHLQALDRLRKPALPRSANHERALLGTCLLLQCEGPAPALAWLARCLPKADARIPLVRVQAAAWPGSIGT
ncbi:MAG: tetratricopeptide repeat protein, partial [Planctomycetota bacterium]|nr:tetratricopeptide repeat protein [Planctomycetota bacterium]